MNNEPIPVPIQRAPRKSRSGLKIAGAVTASVLALGAGAGVLASDEMTAQSPAGTAPTTEPEQSVPASDLFGVTKPTAEPTEQAEAPASTSSHSTATAPTRSTSTSGETEHETETEHSSATSTSGGGDD